LDTLPGEAKVMLTQFARGVSLQLC